MEWRGGLEFFAPLPIVVYIITKLVFLKYRALFLLGLGVAIFALTYQNSNKSISLLQSIELESHVGNIYGLDEYKSNLYIPTKNDTLIIYDTNNKTKVNKNFTLPKNKLCGPDLVKVVKERVYMSCTLLSMIIVYDIKKNYFII